MPSVWTTMILVQSSTAQGVSLLHGLPWSINEIATYFVDLINIQPSNLFNSIYIIIKMSSSGTRSGVLNICLLEFGGRASPLSHHGWILYVYCTLLCQIFTTQKLQILMEINCEIIICNPSTKHCNRPTVVLPTHLFRRKKFVNVFVEWVYVG